MTINERIRYFRKNVLNINQRQFASDLGMAQTGVSGFERDGATVTDRAIRSICLAYDLNEEWLRYGTEPMYIKDSQLSLDDFLTKRNATKQEREIIQAYFELEEDVRKMLFKHFKSRLTASHVEEEEAAYIKSRSASVQKTGLSASNTTAGIENSENKIEKASSQ